MKKRLDVLICEQYPEYSKTQAQRIIMSGIVYVNNQKELKAGSMFPEDTVECIDEGDQSLAEYKLQIGGQPNPFENDIPTEIDDRPVEDYVGEGEDRPGEGKHF